MNYLKSHFQFPKKQRNGILLLLLIILVLQSLYFFVDSPKPKMIIDEEGLKQFQKEIDSLRLVEIENSKLKLFPFNPNFITDYKGYTLGMSDEEINLLLQFRAQDKWINSAQEFQKVTQVSDSLLNSISPFFKFPEWVTNPKVNTSSFSTFNLKPKSFKEKIDLNTATAIQLQRISGIGEVLSERIIKFREHSGGSFIADVQLEDVYGLSPEVIDRLVKEFTVKTPKHINILNLNAASIEQLVTIPHIDYELAYEIIEQRTLRDGFQSFNELTKVKEFPIKKIRIIKLFLTVD